MTLWLTLVGMGAVTFLVRVTPFVALERIDLPPRVRQALVFVPIAVLSAIVAQEVLAPGGNYVLEPGNHRILAALIAGAVAWRTKNVLATVGAGMGALWLLTWLA